MWLRSALLVTIMCVMNLGDVMIVSYYEHDQNVMNIGRWPLVHLINVDSGLSHLGVDLLQLRNSVYWDRKGL